jgi:hypothetical protein
MRWEAARLSRKGPAAAGEDGRNSALGAASPSYGGSGFPRFCNTGESVEKVMPVAYEEAQTDRRM